MHDMNKTEYKEIINKNIGASINLFLPVKKQDNSFKNYNFQFIITDVKPITK